MTTQREVSTLGRALLDQHGLRSWTFGFDSATRRVGCCHYDRRQITVSRHYVALNDLERIRLTILHEIAHALTPGHGHDRVWARKCREIGGTGTTRTSQAVAETVRPAAKWIGTCASNCGRTYERQRLTPRVRLTSHCLPCSPPGQFPDSSLITWKANS